MGMITVKVLTGLVMGKWIMSPEWITESHAKGEWLSEERFTRFSFFPIV